MFDHPAWVVSVAQDQQASQQAVLNPVFLWEAEVVFG